MGLTQPTARSGREGNQLKDRKSSGERVQLSVSLVRRGLCRDGRWRTQASVHAHKMAHCGMNKAGGWLERQPRPKARTRTNMSTW